MEFNAVHYVKKYKTVKYVPRNPKPRKLSSNFDRWIIRIAKAVPKKTAMDIYKEVLSGEGGKFVDV